MKVNKNYYWACLFAEEMLSAGVEHIVISPGSRSTPLALAFTLNTSFQCHSVIDERSAGFFASGIARVIHKPVVLLCTSGTAVAEYYPAVIEAYQQRIPLIVCTADRPSRLIDTGANQTIHQHNFYANHIRGFYDVGLPIARLKEIKSFKKHIQEIVYTAMTADPGPVHINFPFEKPFEPFACDSDISKREIKKIAFSVRRAKYNLPDLREVEYRISSSKKLICLVGPGEHSEEFQSILFSIVEKYHIPLFAELTSNFRQLDNDRIIRMYDSFLKIMDIHKKIQPDIVIIFGRTMTSLSLERYLSSSKSFHIIVNEYGDRFDPTPSEKIVVQMPPERFLLAISSSIKRRPMMHQRIFCNEIMRIDKEAQQTFRNVTKMRSRITESEVGNDILKLIQEDSNIMLGNSMTYRDMDSSAARPPKRMRFYHNRGASGIDGIISTAAGIAISSRRQTYLMIGDISFYYDINALWLLKKYKIPLVVFVWNNGGGKIFNHLPVAHYKEICREYFQTPVEIDTKKIVEGFGGKYVKVSKKSELLNCKKIMLRSKAFCVIELMIHNSASDRQKKEFQNTLLHKLLD